MRHTSTVLALGFCLLINLSMTANAQQFAGSASCKGCHADIYQQYNMSGHPYKMQPVDSAPPEYPQGTSPGVPEPPEGTTWEQTSYVIGGYGWKARFMDAEGYVLTGENRQFNLANAEHGKDAHWVGYEADKAPRKPYDCGGCHTTGWVPSNAEGPHQANLPGIHGTWAEPGVTCEACHGPSQAHIAAPTSVKTPTGLSCGTCHARGDVTKIDAKDGLVKHHEQYEDLLASPHRTLDCTACHDPHKSSKYKMGGYRGDDLTCKTCHADVQVKMASKTEFACTSCHMPLAGKSAVSSLIQYVGGTVPKGDVRSHINRISTDPTWTMFTDDGQYVRVDADQNAYLTVDYACLSCHTDKDMTWALNSAKRVH